MAEVNLSPTAIIEQFKKNQVSHVVWLPDTETNFMYNQIIEDDDLQLVPICREGESMPIAGRSVDRRQEARGADSEHWHVRGRRLDSGAWESISAYRW